MCHLIVVHVSPLSIISHPIPRIDSFFDANCSHRCLHQVVIRCSKSWFYLLGYMFICCSNYSSLQRTLCTTAINDVGRVGFRAYQTLTMVNGQFSPIRLYLLFFMQSSSAVFLHEVRKTLSGPVGAGLDPASQHLSLDDLNGFLYYTYLSRPCTRCSVWRTVTQKVQAREIAGKNK